MITITHVLSKNGTSHTEIPNDTRIEFVIRRAPALMDGRERFAISLSRLPVGKRLRDDLPASWADLFLQAAGSADAMMVEIRKENPGGSAGLYRLARPLPEKGHSSGTVDIVWNGRVDGVPAEEAFDAAEAGEVFWYYYQHDAVPEKYELRFLE
ncbi:hypothetical protein G7067_06885 [Leucobacter insecticola]|uniref:Uncharacterized protein n=1 Tax=Leucobacter insecticola TaxID=2714934 RepID=A0A6G8FIU4_9MICO|nr:hypothetical protein [Leucobacter insecticola]QIM16209.1 hypothetical protein G7067_06885 [Leucobacter insecticola]